MKLWLFVLLAFVGLSACKKENGTLTKQDTYKEIVYRIQTQDSNLTIAFMRAVYTSTVKGNIQKDSVLTNPGFYSIPATVLTGAPVMLFAVSQRGPNFKLEIADNVGMILAATDTITHYPATALDTVEKWVSKLNIVP